MRELLERWASLEPERCTFGEIAAWMVLSGNEEVALHHTELLASEHAVILAAVIEAIEARGGSWELRGSGCPASARVTLNGAARGGCIADEPTDPPAFALLGAYLRVLEAEKAEVNRAAIAEQEHGWRDR